MAKDPSAGDLVGDIPAEWTRPPTESQLFRLSVLNEQLDLPERYYEMMGRLLRTSIGVRRAIALFEKYGTPK